MTTIDFCIEEDGFVFISQPDSLPCDEQRVKEILEDEGVARGQYGELYLEEDGYQIDIHDN